MRDQFDQSHLSPVISMIVIEKNLNGQCVALTLTARFWTVLRRHKRHRMDLEGRPEVFERRDRGLAISLSPQGGRTTNHFRPPRYGSERPGRANERAERGRKSPAEKPLSPKEVHVIQFKENRSYS